MPYVNRNAQENIIGVFGALQPGHAEEFLPGDAPELAAFYNPPQPPPGYRELRAEAYAKPVEEGGLCEGGAANTIEAMADTLDNLIAQVEAMRVELGATALADYAAMLDRIAAIKAAHPEPES